MKNYIIITLQSFFISFISSSTNAWQQALLPSSHSTNLRHLLSNNHQSSHRINSNEYYLKTTTTSRKSTNYNDVDTNLNNSNENENNEMIPPCYYKVGDKWKKRILLDQLRVGQKIIGERITNADLLQAKTGPKS